MLPSWLVRKARQSRVALHAVGGAVRILGIEHSFAKIYAGHVTGRLLIPKVRWMRQVMLDWGNLNCVVVSTLGVCTKEIWPPVARPGPGQTIKLGCKHQEEQNLFLRQRDKLVAEVAWAHRHWVPRPTAGADPLPSTPAHVSLEGSRTCHGLYECPLKVHWYSGWCYWEVRGPLRGP